MGLQKAYINRSERSNAKGLRGQLQEPPTFVQKPNLCLTVVEGLCSPFPDRFGDADAVGLVRNDLTPAVRHNFATRHAAK